MFRKLSSALYQAAHKQLLATLKNMENVNLKNAFGDVKDTMAQSFLDYKLPVKITNNKKITIVGGKESSLVMAMNCLNRNLCQQICIMDYQDMKRKSKSNFSSNLNTLITNQIHIKATKYFHETRNSDLIILTKDIKFCKDSVASFKDSLAQYTNVMGKLIPNLVKYSPNTTFLIDTDRADIVTYVAWKLSHLPKNRVLSSHQINDYIRRPLNNNDRCPVDASTTDVSAKVIENYQRILLSTLPSVSQCKEVQQPNKNLNQIFSTSPFCRTIGFLNIDIMFEYNPNVTV